MEVTNTFNDLSRPKDAGTCPEQAAGMRAVVVVVGVWTAAFRDEDVLGARQI